MPPLSIHYPWDVLVIGDGSAVLRAAIEAHDAGAHVIIISKNRKEILTRCLLEGYQRGTWDNGSSR